MATMEVSAAERQDIERFSKFVDLPNELRHHILTYSDSQTLLEYSQCAKLCNSEIQHFNTITPMFVNLTEESDGILVEFTGCYIDDDKRMGEKKLLYAESENIMKDVGKYLETYYKNKTIGKTRGILINLRRWPKEILNIKKIEEIGKWVIFMYRSMFNDCIEFAKSTYGSLNSLHLYEGEEVGTIPRDFFKCDAIKNLKELTAVNCEVDNDDFLLYWPLNLTITSSISFELIREKVRRFNEMEVCRTQFLNITLPDDDERALDLDVLFPQEVFHNSSYLCKNCLNLGRVQVTIHSTTKTLYLYRDDVDENHE